MSSMLYLILVAMMATYVIATMYDEEDYYAKKTTTTTTKVPTNECYQCSYSPGRTVYKERKIVKRVHDPVTGKYKIVREKKLVPEKKIGGWDKCGGVLNEGDARKFGIDTWDCKSNCMVRVDKRGNLFRGCYRGEFGVDPNNVEDVQEVFDSQYKFCSGSLCNSFTREFV